MSNDISPYGSFPLIMGEVEFPEWTEFMHYLYLPVVMPGQGDDIRLPANLEFLRGTIERIMSFEGFVSMDDPRYVYVTARRGFAAPGNPLNRPGWHSDGFGSQDVNVIWADRWPTRIATGIFQGISEDHAMSAKQFDVTCENALAYQEARHDDIGNMEYDCTGDAIRVSSLRRYELARLDPSVIHSVPIIPAPGGERAFLKISLSKSKYNLLGNSHNHLFDYKWDMYSREQVRNDPAFSGGDSFKG